MNATLINETNNATSNTVKQSSLRILRVRETSKPGNSAYCFVREAACAMKFEGKGRQAACDCKIQG